MCLIDGCPNKEWKNGFCYKIHRKLANAATVAEPIVAEPIVVEPIVAEPIVADEFSDLLAFAKKPKPTILNNDKIQKDVSRNITEQIAQTSMSPNNIISQVPIVYKEADSNVRSENNAKCLFKHIFDLEKGGPRVENLRSIDEMFYERFDANKLAFIINNESTIKKMYRPEARDGLNIKQYYIHSLNGNRGLGEISVKYIQNHKDTLRGRYQAYGSLSAQNMVREVRHTIFNDYYVDIDIDNCHPVIIVWLCHHLNIKCDYLKEYVSNREKHMEDLIDANDGFSRGQAKILFLTIGYGGSEKYKGLKTKTAFIEGFYNEMKRIREAICDRFKYFKACSDSLRQSKQYNYAGAALSHICHFVENQLLMMIVEYLKSKISDIKDSVLCFDGIMINKSKYDESFMPDIEKMFSDVGLDIKMSMKKMEPIDLTQFGYNSNDTYTVSTYDDKYDLSPFHSYQIDEDKLINAVSEAAEKDKWIVVCAYIEKLIKLLPKDLIRSDEFISPYDIVCREGAFTIREIALVIRKVFAYIYDYGEYKIYAKTMDSVISKDTKIDIITYTNMGGARSKAFSNDSFRVRVGDEYVSISLKPALCRMSKSLMYRNADVIPHSPLKEPSLNGTFNLFGRYQHTYDPDFVIDEELVSIWTNHIHEIICDGRSDASEYMLNWFAHLLQRPEIKMGKVPLIKSNQGAGENICFNIFQRYVMNPSLTITCADMEKVFGRFNGSRLGKCLIVLDEAVDSHDRKLNNRMKNFITEDRIQIEIKGHDTYEVNDFSNYAILTNNDFASIIEDSDRRYYCLVASNSRIGDSEYFQNMSSKLMNVEAGKHIFHWLLRRDLSTFNLNNMPNTDYKKKLAARQANSVVKWLLWLLDEMRERGVPEDHIDSMGTNEWYSIYSEWCSEYGKCSALSVRLFAELLSNAGIPRRQSKLKGADGKRVSVYYRCISIDLLCSNLSSYIHDEPIGDDLE